MDIVDPCHNKEDCATRCGAGLVHGELRSLVVKDPFVSSLQMLTSRMKRVSEEEHYTKK